MFPAKHPTTVNPFSDFSMPIVRIRRRLTSYDCRLGTWLPALLVLLIACGGDDGQTADGGATPSVDASTAARAGERAPMSDTTGARGEVPLTVEVSAGSERAELTGRGKCTHAKMASIYGVPAALWQIQDSDRAGKIRHASLSVWRPSAGDVPDQFSMAISTASTQYRIDTVKGGQMVGSGSVTVHPMGEGAHFEVVGTDADGRSVRAAFQCTRFTEHVAEGG